jgi:hypothetical protein
MHLVTTGILVAFAVAVTGCGGGQAQISGPEESVAPASAPEPGAGGQCDDGTHDGDVKIKFSRDVEAYGGCRVITGDLAIESKEIVNLQGLSGVTEVGGALSVGGTERLAGLDGLQNLASVGGYLYIGYNTALVDLTGLSGLKHLGGALTVEKNPALPTCQADRLKDRLADHGYEGTVSIFENDHKGRCP